MLFRKYDKGPFWVTALLGGFVLFMVTTLGPVTESTKDYTKAPAILFAETDTSVIVLMNVTNHDNSVSKKLLGEAPKDARAKLAVTETTTYNYFGGETGKSYALVSKE